VEGPLVWLTLARAPGVGRVRLATLMAACPDPADAWRLGVSDLMSLEGWQLQAAQGVMAVRKDREARRAAEQEWAEAVRAGLRLVALPDPDYPVRLRLTPDPPPYFYQAGPWQPDHRPVVAIVGTRKPTAYGLAVAERFGAEVAAAGAVVVSGMARGIDLAAHKGALRAGGTTVAVLGGGADVCYPREARAVYEAIRASGGIISEQPPGTPPLSRHFPERNRIISGLSHGVVVVEAGQRSGTLLTVSAALRQGRDVFAVPGPITSPMSMGPHELIRDGACLVTCAQDVLRELGVLAQEPAPPALPRDLGEDQARVLGWMGHEPRWAGDLSAACGLSAGEVQSILTILEVRGLVRQLPGGQYVRVG
jgi:DNA processing protein